MSKYRNGSHTASNIKYHFVWITKYRYKILQGKIACRLRELLKQGRDAKGLEIVRGSVSKDHAHMLLSCPTAMSPSQIAQYLKGRSSHLLQDEFPELKRRYWGQHMWRGVTSAELLEKSMKRQSSGTRRNRAPGRRKRSLSWNRGYFSRPLAELQSATRLASA